MILSQKAPGTKKFSGPVQPPRVPFQTLLDYVAGRFWDHRAQGILKAYEQVGRGHSCRSRRRVLGRSACITGCYSQAETVDELLANLREAIAGVLEVMQEEGRTIEENVQVVELAV
jgi:hypothetical protein